MSKDKELKKIPSSIFTGSKNKITVEKIKNIEGELYDAYTFNFWYSPS